MPDRVYEFITTAASLMLLYNWMFVIFAYPKLIELTKWGRVKQWTGVVLIVAAVSGTLLDESSRPGFFISCFLLESSNVFIFMQDIGKRKAKRKTISG